ncbi:hypothetical protein ARZXY2_4734 (plasmid) [Arthrobacter sp. ZXY-2]|nr:hypothetical protein ARZXY2_4734 [Arthrobacter sp. ZXY-2]
MHGIVRIRASAEPSTSAPPAPRHVGNVNPQLLHETLHETRRMNNGTLC